MQVHTRQWSHSLALALTLSVIVACGDDDTTDDSAQAGTSATAGKGGGGGAKAGAGGASGSKAGAGGAKAGAGGASGAAAPAGMFMCLEEPGKDAVKCGGETCTPPSFGMNTCIVACCVQEGGKEICGAKSTAMGLTTECSAPIKADPACPKVDDGMGGMLDGCCNPKQKKCGIISSLRPSCVTESMLVTLPSPLQDCSGGSEGADAGSPDAG